MPRTARIAPGGMIYHVLNRANGGAQIFDANADYAAFEKILAETAEQVPMRLCAFCLMPNHWHLVLWPRGDGDLARFMQRLTITHVRRWQEHRHVVGTGHLYQGRYKSFPVQSDEHFLQLVRYVERNALRANLVKRAEDWRWGSLWRRAKGGEQGTGLLSAWPVARPKDWVRRVNEPENEKELAALRRCVQRGQPFGREIWTKRTARRLRLESAFRPRGRPRQDRRVVGE